MSVLGGMALASLVGTGANVLANVGDKIFNSQQAQLQREWQEEMSNTAYQRQVADMKKAGLNPYISMSGGSGAVVPTGATASHTSGNLVNTASLINSILNSKTARDVALIRNLGSAYAPR